MKTTSTRSAEEAFWTLIGQARKIALEDIERRARAIMKQHPRCKSFCMAMGSTSFYDAQGVPVGDWGPLPYPRYMRGFDRVVDAYNLINVTGEPMKIEGHDGALQKDW